MRRKSQKEDRRLTERLQKAGGILRIPLIDHIIVAGKNYYSFRDGGEMNE